MPCDKKCAGRPGFWSVRTYKQNHSAFNGGKPQASSYSEVNCLLCRSRWRTKAAYVERLMETRALIAECVRRAALAWAKSSRIAPSLSACVSWVLSRQFARMGYGSSRIVLGTVEIGQQNHAHYWVQTGYGATLQTYDLCQWDEQIDWRRALISSPELTEADVKAGKEIQAFLSKEMNQ